MINEKIFKSYDIRGVYPQELNEQAAYAIGRAFARKAQAKAIVVGSDMRLSGPQLKAELIKGIIDEGVDVIDIGLVTIDAVYFCVGILKHEAGIMITASHNPKEYNGFKMALKDMKWVRGEELKDDVFSLPEATAETKGKVIKKDILPDYIKHILSFCDLKKIKNKKVVVDAGNGMAGLITPLLQKHLPIEIVPLNFELDGNFPAHPSNPLMPESQVQVTRAVVENQADFGVIFDGDTDRLFFVDEKGNFIRADYTLLILAREFLNRQPGVGIVYNAICSKIVPEKIKEWGGVAHRCKVGFVNVSGKVRETNSAMGGELSAHYCFKDNAYSDSGFIAFVLLLQLLSEIDKPLSAVVSDFQIYAKSDEINIEVSDWRAVIEEIKVKYQDGKQDELDGLTVEYEDWWFNVRPSNTEPLLRITIEANTEQLAKDNLRIILDFINKIK